MKQYMTEARRAQAFLLTLLMTCQLKIDPIRAVCNTAVEVTPKTLPASWQTITLGYEYRDTAIGSSYYYYINHGGSGADFFDITNTADCSFYDCYSYFVDSGGSWMSTSYGDVSSGGVAYLDSNAYNPTTSSAYTNIQLYVRCRFQDQYEYVISNPMTVTMACICNQYTVTLTDTESSATESVEMTTANQPRWLLRHWTNSNTPCCETEPTSGSIANLAVYSDSACSVLHTDLEVVYYNSVYFYLQVSDVANKMVAATYTFYLAYTTVADSQGYIYKIPVDIDGTSALTLTVTCGASSTTFSGGDTWSGGLGRTQYVQVNDGVNEANQPTATYFQLPIFTTDNTGCPITNREPSIYATYVSNPSYWLNSAVEIGTSGEYKFVPKDISVHYSYNIYVFVYAQGQNYYDGFRSHYDYTNNYYILHVGCPSAVASMTENTALVTQHTGNWVKDPAIETEEYLVPFLNPTSYPSYCSAVSNTFYSYLRYRTAQIPLQTTTVSWTYTSGTYVWFDAGCVQPCTTLYVLASTIKSYNWRFQVQSTDQGGTNLQSSYIYYEAAQCGTASTTIGNPSTLTTLLHTKIISGSTHSIAMGTFTNSQSLCPIQTIEIFASDGTTTHPDLTLTKSGDSATVYLSGGLTNVKGTYPFKVKVTAEGGRTHWADVGGDTLFTMDVICGPSSTVLSESTYSGSYTDQQLIDHSNNNGVTQFMLPTFVSSYPGCVILTRETTATSGTVAALSPYTLGDPTLSGSDYVVIPTSIDQDYEYTFFVKATADGGAVFWTTEKKLIVGCTNSVIVHQFTGDSVRYVGDSNIAIYSYMLPTVIRSYCRIIQVSVANVRFDGVPSTTALTVPSSCTQPCATLNLDTTNMERDITFNLVYTLESTLAITYTSSELKLSIECQAESTTISSTIDTSRNYTYYKDSATTLFQFRKFECSNEACCQNGLTYRVLSQPTDKNAIHTQIPELNLDATDTNVYTNIPTTSVGTYIFYVYARNSYNVQEFSGKIVVNVLTDCTQDVITMKSTEVSSTVADTINPLVAHFWEINQKPRLVFNTYTHKISNFTVNLASRFEKVSDDGWQGCDFSGYKIDYVMQKYTNNKISYSDWSELFTFDTTTGQFTMTQFNQSYGHYQIYVAASNGHTWSDSASQGWLVEVIFINNTPSLPNVPPYMWPAPTYMQVKPASMLSGYNNSDRFAIYKFPEILDMNINDTYTVSVTGLKRWMSFNNKQGHESIEFDQSMIPDSLIGNYTLSILMWDQNNSRNFYQLRVEVLGYKHFPIKRYVIKQRYQEPFVESNVSARINSLDRFGRLEIQFVNLNNVSTAQPSGKRMLGAKSIDTFKAEPLEMDTSKIDPIIKALDIHVKPANQRELDEAYNETTIGLEWEVESFEKDTLVIRIRFKHHREISPGVEQDKIVVGLKPGHASALVSKETGQRLDSDFRVIEWKIPKQLAPDGPDFGLAVAAQVSTVGLRILLIALFVLSMWLPGTMFQILALMRTLQVVCHLPMLGAATPGNVSIIYERLIVLAWYDVLPANWFSSIFYAFDMGKQAEAYKGEDEVDQIMDVGYVTHNWMLNTRTLGILVAFYVAKLLFFVGYRPWMQRREEFKQKEKMVERNWESWERDWRTWHHFVRVRDFLLARLFWLEILALMLEAEFEMLIAGYLQMKDPVTSTWGEIFSSFLAVFGLCAALVGLPGAIIYVLRQEVVVLSQTRFQLAWGPVYEGLRMESKWTLAYYLVYTIRRIIFVFIAVFLPCGAPQLVLLQYLNLFIILYKAHHKPLDSRFKNRFDFGNELFIALLTTHMLFFTDWIPKFDTQTALGASMIFWTWVCIVYNLLNIIYIGQHHFWMVRTRKREQIALIKEYLMSLKDRLFQTKKHEIVVEKLDIEMDGRNQEVMMKAALEFMKQPQDQEFEFLQKDPAMMNLGEEELEIQGTDWVGIMKKYEEAKVDYDNFDQNPDDYIKNNLNQVQMDIDLAELSQSQEEEEDQQDQIIVVKSKSNLKDKLKNVVADENKEKTEEPPQLSVQTPELSQAPINYWEEMKKEFETGVYDDSTEFKKDNILEEEINTVRVLESRESKKKGQKKVEIQKVDHVWPQPLKTSKIELQPQVAQPTPSFKNAPEIQDSLNSQKIEKPLKNESFKIDLSKQKKEEQKEEKKSTLAEIFAQKPVIRKTIVEDVEKLKIDPPKEVKKKATPKDQIEINLLKPKQPQDEIKIDLLKPLEIKQVKPIELTLPKTEKVEPEPQLTFRKQDNENELLDVINNKTQQEAEFQVDFEKKNNLSLNAVKAHLFGMSDDTNQQNNQEISLEKPRYSQFGLDQDISFQSRSQSRVEPTITQKQRYKDSVDMFSSGTPVLESTEMANNLPRFGLLPSEPQKPAQNVNKDESVQFDLLNYRPDVNVMKDMNKLLQVGRDDAEKKND